MYLEYGSDDFISSQPDASKNNNVITFLNYKFSEKKNMAKNAGVYYEKNFSREIFLMKINSYFNLN